MTVLTVRSYHCEVDLELIVNLLNDCEAVDQEDNYYSVSDLQTEIAEPGFDPAQNIQLWEDAAGRLVAFALLWTPTQPVDLIDGFLWFRVRPVHRWQGIEFDVLRWGETRICQIAVANALPVKLFVGCRDFQAEQITFFEQQGFRYERCFFTMVRSLIEPVIEPQLPKGFQIVQAQAEDVAAWVEMYNQTFIDHWSFHPETVEERSYWVSTSKYCPKLDLVAIAPDGTFAAFCYAHIDAERNQQQNRREGWISSLGTRRGFRRLGLGRAMLLAGLQRLQAAGMDTAKLGVDRENPNCAQSLYESVGFRQLYANLFYAKLLRV